MLRYPQCCLHFPAQAGLAVHGTTETLWRAVLQSRVAESVLVHVGEPFHAPDVPVTWSKPSQALLTSHRDAMLRVSR